LLQFEEAVALTGGHAPFEEFGPYPLRLVFEVEGFALVCSEEFPARHAWLVTRALAKHLPVSRRLAALDDPELVVHDGSRTFIAGGPEPILIKRITYQHFK